MKQPLVSGRVNETRLFPQKNDSRILVLLLLFFVGVSAAFTQENMQSSAGEFVYPFEKAEKKEGNIFL